MQGSHEPTIGCNCQEIDICVNGEKVRLMAWDTAGQEVYRAIVPIYTRDSAAALLVYDTSAFRSFGSLEHWHSVVMDHQASDIKLYVVANKIDLPAVVSDQQGRLIADKFGASYHEVSAKTGEGIRELFNAVAAGVMERVRIHQSQRLQQKTGNNGCC
jgi:small GTP-binding protein